MPNQMQDALIEALSTIPEAPTPEPEPTEPDVTAEPVAEAPESPPEPPKAEPVAEAKPEPERVPLAVLLDERAQKREATERARLLERELAELRAQQQAKPVEPPAPPIPALADDPVANLDARARQLEEATRKAQEDAQRAQEQLQGLQREQAIKDALVATEAAYVAQNPDYFDALAHVRSAREAQLKMLFQNATTEQIRGQIALEERQLAQGLLMQGMNPAQYAYEMAKTIGYRKTEPKVESVPDNVVPIKPEPDREAVRTLGSGQAAVSEPEEGNPLDTLLATARKERGFKR